MKRGYIFAALLGGLLVALLFYTHGGGHAPSGQPALVNLTAQNVTAVENDFNAARDDVRVLLLLSPT